MSNNMSRAQESDNSARRMYDIILGAERNDFNEVDGAVLEDSTSIIFREPNTGMTALHVAAGDGNLAMVRHLLSKEGADISIKDKFGRDPLDLAIAIGHTGVVETLSRLNYPKSFSDEGAGSTSIAPFTPRP